MSRLFEIKNFLIIEGFLLILIFLNYFAINEYFGTFGSCIKCEDAKCIEYIDTSCAKVLGQISLRTIFVIFILYLALFAIYKLIELKRKKDVQQQ